MKTISWLILLACLSAKWTSSPFAAETALVKRDAVNVRGQHSTASEVITQLKKGDKVTVLEEITIKKPKPDEPSKWLRIQMPSTVPVWVFAQYINTDNKTVKAARLNLRAGPGENYSVVGVLEKGALIKPIRTIEEWIEVETPETAYAFIAENLVDRGSQSAVAEKPELTATKPKPVEATQPVTIPPAMETVKIDAAPKPPTDAAPLMIQPGETAILPPPAATTNIMAAPLLTPPPLGVPSTPVEDPAPKRTVRREGVVRGANSIQAPTAFELHSKETGKVLNYLYATSTNIVLKKYRGKNVFITGEEAMDERWRNTPVLKIESLELAPDANEQPH